MRSTNKPYEPSLAIFSRTYDHDARQLHEVFAAAARDGYAGVHFNFSALGLPTLPEWLTPLTCEGVASSAEAAGLRIVGVSATYNMIHPDCEQRELYTRRAEHLIELAGALQTDLVTVCTGTRDPHDMWQWHPDNQLPSAWNDLLLTLERLRTTAQRSQVTLGIEPETANVVCSAQRAHALLETLGTEGLQIILDPANLLGDEQRDRRAVVITEAVTLLSPWIAVFHAKQYDGALYGPRGVGAADLELSLSLLAEHDFRGPIVVHDVRERDAAAARERLSALLKRHFQPSVI
jgi:sugar phosphate isomerase/epimerase